MSKESPSNIVIFINVDWFALSHFIKYLKKLLNEGNEITLITADTGKIQQIKDEGIKVNTIALDKGYSGIFKEIRSLIKIYMVIKELKPDVLELITIKPILYGGICGRLLGINKIIFYMAGLGAFFTNKGLLSHLKGFIIGKLYKVIMSSNKSRIILENKDDLSNFQSLLKIPKDNFFLIPGVGIDFNSYPEKKHTQLQKNIKILMIGRLLYDKGVMEYAQASKVILESYPDIEFSLAGDSDGSNPSSISLEDLDLLKNSTHLNYLGFIEDIPLLLSETDLFILPSYREGFPKSIMEASASGIPSITTDVVGCRSAVIDHETGILIKPRQVESIVNAIKFFLQDLEQLRIMGSKARQHALANFDERILTQLHIEVLKK